MPVDADVTRILADLSAGDRSAVERLLPHVYDELRARAAIFLSPAAAPSDDPAHRRRGRLAGRHSRLPRQPGRILHRAAASPP